MIGARLEEVARAHACHAVTQGIETATLAHGRNHPQHMTQARVSTYCALCISRCGCTAIVDEGRLLRVEPDPQHPTGSAICIKAKTAPEFVHHPDRLTTPLLRSRPKGDRDPGFRPIGWEDALALIAAKLQALSRDHGPQSVAFAITTPSGTAVADSFGWIHRLAHAFGSPNLVFATENCNWHKDFSPALTWGAGIGMPEFARTRTIVLWGFNPTATWLSQVRLVREAQRRGAKLVVIDPRRQGLASRADLWLAPRPGTDAALALGLAHLLLERGAADREFLRHYSDACFLVREDGGALLTEADVMAGGRVDRPLVWDETLEAPVAYDPRTRDYVVAATRPALTGRHEIAGHVCRPVLDALRERCAQFPPERVSEVTGVSRDGLSLLAEWLATEGPVSFFTWTGTAQHSNATQTTRAMNVLYALLGHLDAPGGNVWFGRPPTRDIAGFEWVSEETRARTLGRAERPLGPSQFGWITTRDLFRAVVHDDPYPVKALVSFGGNFALTKPATRDARQALQQLDFFVMTELFLTHTTRDADLVLPVASCWEREGLQAGFVISEEAERWVQLRPAAVPPRGESRSDTSIVFALADRLGLGDRFFDGDEEAGLRHVLEPTGLTPAVLRANRRGVSTDAASRHRKYETSGFATPSGRLELNCQRLLEIGDDPLPAYRMPMMSPEARPDLAREYPLRLTCAKWPQFCHSQQRQQSSLRRAASEPLVEIHPDAAVARAIGEGDAVEVRTPHGRFVGRARLTSSVSVEMVCAQYGWWHPELLERSDSLAYSYNAAIDGEIFDPLSGSNELRAYLCEVERQP
ncbi:MAG: molybdopterin-dependent oxidoreductase [Acidobacteria bacterium]|nr:molybdopterin-dependent oxidoreductase [Acidobacteriota bacterium]